MGRIPYGLLAWVIWALLALAWPCAAGAAGDAVRGEYLVNAAGCGVCHTDTPHGGIALAGGRALPTPFGTFYTPNITPDPQYGIGAWSDTDFLKAMRQGVSPDGHDYYPAFPYVSFTMMSDRDMLDIKAYLFTQTAVPRPSRPHDLRFPYSLRFTLMPWKVLFFRQGPFVADPKRSAEWNRGAYLAQAVAHCGECHTPRNALGAVDKSQRFGGAPARPGMSRTPNITPDPQALGPWTTGDIAALLKDGITPDGDFVGHAMADVVAGTAKLTDADRKAIAVYLKSVPPLPPREPAKP